MLESKRMNSSVKKKYLAEFTNSLQAHNKSNRMMASGAGNSKYGAEKTKQMGIQTRLALKQTIRNI